MALPELSLPLELPFEVPLLLHPAVAHFAIAIPVVVLLLELSNLYFKRRALSITSTLLLMLGVLLYLGLYVTGKADGSEAFIFLSEAGKAELGDHKLLGTYVIYFAMIVFSLRLLTLWVKTQAASTLYLVMLLLLIGLNIKQGHDGGELVYEHGANVVPLGTCQDEAESLREELEALKAELETLRQRDQNRFDLNLSKAAEMIKELLTLPQEEEGAEIAPLPGTQNAQQSTSSADEPFQDEGVIVIDATPQEQDTASDLQAQDHNDSLSF